MSAPSGCGKSTIIRSIMDRGNVDMKFSVSATNRSPRPGEVNGKNYHFITTEEFRNAIDNDEFVEFEEVYPGRFYGTLKREIIDRCENGEIVVLDIGDDALSIYIMPPSVEELRRRLEGRGTETPEAIDERVNKAEFELSFAPKYDMRVVNDDLDKAVTETEKAILDFIGK